LVHRGGMRHQLFVHLVWTTRDREPLIDLRVARFLEPYIRRVAQAERAMVLELGIVSTHLHLLLRISPQTSLPRLIQRLKGGSSHLAAVEGHAPRGRELRWSKGYSLHSVSPGALQVVGDYVRHQPTHHPAEAIRN
jgi:putative transposase